MDVLFRVDSTETFVQILEDVLDNLYDLKNIGNKIIDGPNIKAIKEDVQNIILDTNLNTNEVNELLQSKFDYVDNDRMRIFVSLLENKKSELLNSTIVHFNCAFGETLKAFDWKLKLVCGTSDLKTLTYSLLQLAFYTVTTNHEPRLRLHELNKEMMTKLIETLEEFVGDGAANHPDE